MPSFGVLPGAHSEVCDPTVSILIHTDTPFFVPSSLRHARPFVHSLYAATNFPSLCYSLKVESPRPRSMSSLGSLEVGCGHGLQGSATHQKSTFALFNSEAALRENLKQGLTPLSSTPKGRLFQQYLVKNVNPTNKSTVLDAHHPILQSFHASHHNNRLWRDEFESKSTCL